MVVTPALHTPHSVTRIEHAPLDNMKKNFHRTNDKLVGSRSCLE